jgi:SpoIID/LytB domain protein
MKKVSAILVALLFLSLAKLSVLAQSKKIAKDKDIELQIGIVQKFGENIKDRLIIKSHSKEAITVKIPKQPTIQVPELNIEIVQKKLKEPVIEEKIILGDYSSYESALDNAKSWKTKGVEVEIGQPERWEVWAKRSRYSTSELRAALLKQIQLSGGSSQAILSSQIRKSQNLLALKIGNKILETNQLEISDKSALFEIKQKDEKIAHLYPGKLVLQPNAYNSYTLVNRVPLEIYLRGVVPNEIGPNAPFNALKAQVILARTYALRNLRRFEIDNYQLCATVHCQVYFGISETSKQADKAIKETRGQVLTYHQELIDALYSEMTGGVTATFRDVWNGPDKPYLKSVIDSSKPIWNLNKYPLNDEKTFRKFISLKSGFNESQRKLFRWDRYSTLVELTKELKDYYQRRHMSKFNFQKLLDLRVNKRSNSGRILSLLVRSDQGEIELQKNEIRSAFSKPWSTLFYPQPVYDPQSKLIGYRFIGGGVGHGVGFSQYGSYNLAQLGWSTEKILYFYYPKTQIVRLSPAITYWKE